MSTVHKGASGPLYGPLPGEPAPAWLAALPSLSAAVPAVLAAALVKDLDAALGRVRAGAALGHVPAAELAAAVAAVEAIHQLGRLWREANTAAGGCAAAPAAAAVPDSAAPSQGEIGTVEAADLLGVGARHVRRLVEAGRLPARKVGRAWLIDRDDLMGAA